LVSIVDSEVKDCDVKQLESFMHAAVEKWQRRRGVVTIFAHHSLSVL
jgi:hypothetical protein